jgi:hypothetical protein
MNNVQELQNNGLQQELDSLTSGTTLELMPPRGEFRGPLVIKEAITIEGKEATLWALQGPVVIVQGKGVVLRNLRIEVTGDRDSSGTDAECAILLAPGAGLTLDNVEVWGTVKGWPEEEGNWQLPHTLQLGRLAYGSSHELALRVQVPVPCKIASAIKGLSIEPTSLRPGLNQLRLQIERLPKDILLDGDLILTTAFLKRRIAVNAYITLEQNQDGRKAIEGTGQIIWEPVSGEKSSIPSFSRNRSDVLEPPSASLESLVPPASQAPQEPQTSPPPQVPVAPSKPQEKPATSNGIPPLSMVQNQKPGDFFAVTSTQRQSATVRNADSAKPFVPPPIFDTSGNYQPPLSAPASQHSNPTQSLPLSSAFDSHEAKPASTESAEPFSQQTKPIEPIASSDTNQKPHSQNQVRRKKPSLPANSAEFFKNPKE